MSAYEENFTEDSFLPPSSIDEEFFEEVGGEPTLMRSYCHTAWTMDSISPDSKIIAQRLGSDQTMLYKVNSVSNATIALAGNVNSQKIINAYPSSWETTVTTTQGTFDTVYVAHKGSTEFQDFAYVSVPVYIGSSTDAVGGFVGLFTGDIVLKSTGYSVWFTLGENTGNDTAFYG